MSKANGFSTCFAGREALLRGALRTLAGMTILALAGMARAATLDGTLITNVATATYGSVGSLTSPGTNPPYEISYAATQTVLVATPNIQLQKTSQPSIECSGGTITFCIWAVNNSSLTSAFDVVLQDRYPPLVAYVPGMTMWAGLTAGAIVNTNWGNGPGQHFAGEPPAGMDASLAAGYYLRWGISVIGPNKSALVCYKGQLL